MSRYLFTSITGGVSAPPYSSFNLGTHVGDSLESVAHNRESLRRFLSLDQIIYMNQVHGTDVVEIGEQIPAEITADALITKRTSIGLAVLTADCIPLLIEGSDYVAAVHVGRKGLVGGIISTVIAELRRRGEDQLRAWIGPAICGSCYEVSLDMYREIIALHPAATTNDAAHSLNLPAAAQAELESLGVKVTNLNICTLESAHHYSYRKSAKTGRMAGIISL